MEQNFDNFVTNETNRLTVEICKAFSTGERHDLNPLLLIGELATGKSHLLKAIKFEFETNKPSAKTLFLSSEQFIISFVKALQTNSVYQFKDKMRNNDLLLIDDIHYYAGKERSQEEFYHTLSDILNSKRLVALSATGDLRKIKSMNNKQLTSIVYSGCNVILKKYSQKEIFMFLKQRYLNKYDLYDLFYDISTQVDADIRLAIAVVNKILFFRELNGSLPSREEILFWLGNREEKVIFISYAWKDKEAVLAVDQWLRNKGARVILDDRNFLVGEDVRDQIIQAIKQSGIVLCFYSSHSSDRPYPKLERRIAEELELETEYSQSRIPLKVIYFCLDDTPLPDHQRYRLAVKAKEKSFESACIELWKGICPTAIMQTTQIDLSQYEAKPPW